MGDINGDGKPDLVVAHYNHSGILWIDFAGPKPLFTTWAIRRRMVTVLESRT